MKKVSYILFFLILMFISVNVALACPIPVFQYALEYWETDPYEVFIFYDDDTQEELLSEIEELKQNTQWDSKINLMVNDNKVLDKDTFRHSVFRQEQVDTLPYMVVYYPRMSGIQDPVFSGEFTKENLDLLLNSPMREKVSNSLLDRKVAVWVLLESGNQSKDQEALKVLEEEIEKMENNLQVPEATSWGIETIVIYDKIEFELLTLSRDNKEEKMFINMLINSEFDLKDYEDVPLAFPIYGRGLILYALVGQGINSWTINEAGRFLVAPCSCQAKALNPGTDLLTTMNWEDKIEPLSGDISTEPSGVGGFLDQYDQAEDM